MDATLARTLEESMPPWSSILDASHNGVIIINQEGRIVVFNQAARRIFRIGDEPLVGSHIFDVRPETWSDLKKVLDTGQPQVGRKIVMPLTTIIANRSPIECEGKVLGVITIFQDISEYESIISELQGYRKLHHDLEAIIESSYDGLYITDGKANTIFVNSAYERITGLSRENLIGRNMTDLVKSKVFDHSVTLRVLKNRRQVTLMQQVMGNKQVIVTGTPIYDESDEISLVVTNVRDITELNELRAELEETRRLSTLYYQSLMEQEGFEHIMTKMVAKSTAMLQVVRKAVKVAKSDTSLLISGESGVGKSMLGRIIHHMSPRKDCPFVIINCGAIPDSLMESELFGYEKGAFTGASTEGKAGLLEVAHTGTVFLDEVGTLKPSMQVKLLEVIEEKTFVRVGGTRPISVDIRIIAATNSDLKDMTDKGLFRKDLYYRLNVIPIDIPPLRQRPEDIHALALSILEKLNAARGQNKRVDPDVLEHLRKYDYPGNVRELVNIMERMYIMSEGDTISLVDMPDEIKEPTAVLYDLVNEGMPLKEAVGLLEAQMIRTAFRRHGAMGRVAQVLGIHPTTLWRKMEKYGIKDAIAK